MFALVAGAKECKGSVYRDGRGRRTVQDRDAACEPGCGGWQRQARGRELGMAARDSGYRWWCGDTDQTPEGDRPEEAVF
jgi:hypothetical protein